MKINVLPKHLVEKIAAGEVVERPASVVKELMENALDALSRRIIVKVGSDKGPEPIEVIDDGEGMSREEVLLAIQRHATSKISVDSDLSAIRTLGFRGEALPSITAVSEMKIETRQPEAPLGVRLIVEAGVVKSIEEGGVPKGTRVQVRRLFFATPARLKFLRSATTEWGHIQQVFERIALSRRDVHFQLWRSGRQWLNAPPTGDLGQRIGQILGWGLAEHLYPFEAEAGGVRLYGMMTRPDYHGVTGRNVLFYVNGRPVRDSSIQKTLRGCYQGYIPKDRFPAVFLFLELPFDQVDVNVHPAKLEVRFVDPRRIALLLSETMRRILKDAPWDRKAIRYVTNNLPWDSAGVAREARETVPASSAESAYASTGSETTSYGYGSGTEENFIQNIKKASQHTAIKEEYFLEAHESTPPQPGRFTDLRVLGQLHDEFIVCASADHLVLIDQHAAHERVAFERLRRAFSTSGIPQQALLIPSSIELSRRDAEVLERHLPEVRSFGLDIEHYGHNTFVVKSVPALISHADPALLLKDIAEELAEGERSRRVEELRDHVFARMACHSVVRGKRRFAPEELQALLEEMDTVDFTLSCPHGRPVLTAWSLTEIRKRFHRT